VKLVLKILDTQYGGEDTRKRGLHAINGNILSKTSGRYN
jgi:hypothetical protein